MSYSKTSRGCSSSVSALTAHSMLCLHLERFALLSQSLPDRKNAGSRPEATRRRPGERKRAVSRTALLLVLMASVATSLWSQSTFGSIRGTVQDDSGAVIPGAEVTLHSVDENTDRIVQADSVGNYLLENVKAGHYSLRARHDGFANAVIEGIELAARQDLRFALSMNIAQQSTTVEVSSAAAEVNTENATIGDSENTAQIGQLPLNFRAASTTPLAALALSPDVQQDSSGNFAIGGATSNMIGFSVDGISSVNVFQSGVALAVNAAGSNPYPSSEGIAELKVTAFNNNAEFSQVGDVTLTTKGGTDSFHGSLFEYLQNDALNARVYGFTEKAPERFNTFGGSIGGPISVPHLYNGHKAFFFFDYEGNRRRTSAAEQYTVPTLQDRMGDLNDIASTFPNGVLMNPFTGQPYPNNQITTPLNQSSMTLLNDYYPLPKLAGILNNDPTLVSTPSNTNGFDGRVDYVINQKQQVYARFNWKNLLVDTVNPLLPDDVDTEHDRSFLISHNYEISNNLLNEFRFGYAHTIVSPFFPIEGAQAIQQLGLQGINVSHHPTDGGFPSINFEAGANFTPIGRDHVGPTQSSTNQLADNLTYTRGRHTIKAGVDVRWVSFAVPEIETPSDDYGLITFNQGVFTQSAFGDLLLGLPDTTYFATTGPPDNAHGVQTGIFGQDEWRMNDHLTVDFGLRWEALPPFVDKNGIFANFDPNTNSVILNKLIYTKLGGPVLAFLQSFNACSAGPANLPAPADAGYAPSPTLPCSNVVLNNQEGLASGLRQFYLRNFDPRVSLAYRPFNNDKTVIRAGFGIFTVTALGQLQNNLESTPEASIFTYTNPSSTGAPQFQFPQIAPASLQGKAPVGGGEIEQAIDPHYRDAQSAQWNLTVERELTSNTAVRASYVGLASYRLNVSVNLNQPVPSSTLQAQNPMPFPNFGTIFSTGNYGHQNYNALELQATHRTGRGLSYQANYTWAHDLSDAQGDAPTTFQGETRYGLADEDRFAINQNRGNVYGTRRNRLFVTGTYELPYGTGRQWSSHSRILDNVLGNWNVNTVTLLEAGPFLTPAMSVTQDQTNTSPQAAGINVVRPDIVGNPIPTQRTNSNYFNINAFAPPPVGSGRVGNASVGSLEGPGTIAVNAGLAKIFSIHDNLKMRFEATFTNVLNHTNFAPPSTDISNPGAFGMLTTAQTAESAGNRTGQAALRIDF